MDHVTVHEAGPHPALDPTQAVIRPRESHGAIQPEMLDVDARLDESVGHGPKRLEAHDSHAPPAAGEMHGKLDELMLRTPDLEVGRDEEHVDTVGSRHRFEA